MSKVKERLKSLGLNAQQLSLKYGFCPAAFGKSVERDGFLAPFLVLAEEKGPETAAGTCLSLSDFEPDGTVGYLRRLVGTEALERRAKLWPTEVTRDNLALWLVTWGMASDAEEADVQVAEFDEGFMRELAAAERKESVEGVRLLVARRLGASVSW